MSLNVLNLSISDDADTAIASGVSSIDVEGQKVTFNLRDGGSKSIEVPAVPGPYFTPEIGKVETLSAGSKATASIDTDTETMKATLNLGIPKGRDGSGGGVDVDEEMSDTSENAVQNKVIKAYVDNHTNPVDDVMSNTSTNPVQNKVVKAYIDSQGGGGHELTEEHKTGDTYNGKPVYEKVFYLGNNINIPTSSSQFPQLGNNFETIINATQIIKDNAEKNTITTCLKSDVVTANHIVYLATVESWAANANRYVSVYLKYTKTTDWE